MAKRAPRRDAASGLLRIGVLALAFGCAHADPPVRTAEAERRLPDGSRYEGERRDGLFHGKGRLVHASGAVYEGEFRHGLRHGHGRYTNRAGAVHEGSYRDGEADREGTLTFPSGDRYEGEWRAGEPEGRGIWRFSDGAVYTGELRDGEFAGRGVLEMADGARYEGDFEYSRFSGLGTFTRADGLRYEGSFRNGSYQGFGVLTRPDDGGTYRGDFVEDEFHGHGVYEFENGKRYEGDFVHGRFTGTGSVEVPKRSRYQGEVRDWKLNGQGRIDFENGTRYEGAFEDDLFHGAGVYTDAEGRRLEGKFERGRFHGPFRVTWRTPEGQERTGYAEYHRGRWLKGDVPGLAPPPAIDAEALLYRQPELVAKALADVAPSRPGVADLYFVGFGSWGAQDVFKHEVLFAQQLFAEQLGAAGRTLTLVNHRDTLETTPLATSTNLRAALSGVAARMDREEDILFLFLTSHGSDQHEIAVAMGDLPLRSLPAERLAALLDEQGFAWRVVVVSACYSGGFLEPLRNEHTLVMTASREDRTSFGCGDDVDFTYFGEAFLRDALAQQPSFVAAFESARRAIAAREEKEGFEHSEPQIASSPAIEAKLAAWRASLPPPSAPAAQADAGAQD